MKVRLMSAWLVGFLLAVGGMADLGHAEYIDFVKGFDPAGYYRLNETTVGTVYDSSGHDRNAVHVGSPDLDQTPGALAPYEMDSAIGGNGLVVDFTTDPGSLFAGGSDPFSVSIWVKPDSFGSLDWGAFVSYGLTSYTMYDHKHFMLAENGAAADGTICIADGGALPLTSQAKLTAGQWNHIGVTYAGGANGMLKLFVNGQPDNSANHTFNVGGGTVQAGRLGDFVPGYGQPYDGLIDEFAYFKKCLTDGQILALSNPAIPEPSSLVLLLLGAVGLFVYARRQRNAAA